MTRMQRYRPSYASSSTIRADQPQVRNDASLLKISASLTAEAGVGPGTAFAQIENYSEIVLRLRTLVCGVKCFYPSYWDDPI